MTEKITTEKNITDKSDTAAHLSDFEALLHTAGLSLAGIKAKPGTQDYTRALGQLYAQAVARWGLGLHHLPHSVSLEAGEVALVSGKAKVPLSGGAQGVARGLGELQAPGEHGLSDWAALPEGWRASITSRAQLRTLIEDARDFETHWAALRADTFYRVWRSGETLNIEVSRPVNAAQLLADAAWDVITSIKDRSFARELMERSKQGGLLQAVLGARHKGAGAALEQNYGAHFTVQSVVSQLEGAVGRDFAAYQMALKDAAQQLGELQSAAVSATASILKGDLR